MDKLTNQQKLNIVLGESLNSFINDLTLQKVFESQYNIQAIDFLIESNTTCKISKVGNALQPWDKDKKKMVDHYLVELKNQRHSYVFDFYGSIHSYETKKSYKYDFYSVLACLDTFYPESFDAFCNELGYEFKNESEYIEVKKVHLACLDQAKNLRKLFSESEIEKLGDIR